MKTLMNKNELAGELKRILRDDLEGVKEVTAGEELSEEAMMLLNKMNYKPKGKSQNRKDAVYNTELERQYYLCRYGIAYAFEYAMIYDIVMRSYMEKNNRMLGAFSFGCGSMLDAWSMAYARQQLAEEDEKYKKCRLYYKGVDVKRWGKYFMEPGTSPEKKTGGIFENITFERSDINSFLDKLIKKSPDSSVYYNVLMFPKILNELKPEETRKMIEKLSECNFDRDEYYICVSQSRFDVEKGIEDVGAERGLKAVQDMVAAINADGKFEVCSDLKEILGESYEGFRKTWLGDGEAELTTVPVLEELGTYNCYEFGRLDKSGEGTQMRKPPVGIASLNSDFKCPEIEKYLRDLAKKPGVKPELRVNQVVTVRNIVFQVIRLRKERV